MKASGLWNRLFWFLLALLPMAVPVRAADVEYTLQAKGEIEIGPDGSVRDYSLETKLTPAVADRVDRSVRGWRFEPITVDGRPVIARTRMTIGLRAEPVEGGYRLHVADVWFGTGSVYSSDNRVPHYPEAALRERLGAEVLLVVRLDPSGSVIDIHPYQTSLSEKISERRAELWRKVFEKSSIQAVKTWKFDPTEIIDGKPTESSVIVPVHYRISPSASLDDGRWSALVPGPIKPAPWVESATVDAPTIAGLANGEAASLTSRFKLRDEVIGRLL